MTIANVFTAADMRLNLFKEMVDSVTTQAYLMQPSCIIIWKKNIVAYILS